MTYYNHYKNWGPGHVQSSRSRKWQGLRVLVSTKFGSEIGIGMKHAGRRVLR